MKKLGIIGAMEVEVEILLGIMEDKQETVIGGCHFFEGKLEGMDAVVVQCGVGKVNAAMCAQILCSNFGVDGIVNTGVAGSLDAKLDICDLVVSSDAMHHDMDVTGLGYAHCQVPGLEALAFPADEKLMKLAFAAAEAVNPGHTKYGRVASGDQFVASNEMKEAILRHTQASCTEMEGAAIAHVAYRNQVPYVILRAISDKADGSSTMDYPAFEKIAARHCARVTRLLAKELAEPM